MKKVLFVMAAALFMAAGMVDAQPRAIGGRLGYGAEVSYQHSLGSANMLEVDFGLPGFGGLEAAVTYDWLFPITSWQEQGTWNWYAGVGAGLGMYGFNHVTGYAGVAGRIGVEYNFWFPLNLSLDWRPIVGPYFSENHVGFNGWGLWQGGIALGVRYLF